VGTAHQCSPASNHHQHPAASSDSVQRASLPLVAIGGVSESMTVCGVGHHATGELASRPCEGSVACRDGSRRLFQSGLPEEFLTASSSNRRSGSNSVRFGIPWIGGTGLSTRGVNPPRFNDIEQSINPRKHRHTGPKSPYLQRPIMSVMFNSACAIRREFAGFATRRTR